MTTKQALNLASKAATGALAAASISASSSASSSSSSGIPAAMASITEATSTLSIANRGRPRFDDDPVDISSALGRSRIVQITESSIGKSVAIGGWVKTARDHGNNAFLAVNDGSCLHNLQVVIDKNVPKCSQDLSKMSTGASVWVEGKVVKSPAKGQAFELLASSMKVVGECPGDTYPMQKTKLSAEHLRENAHLRVRTDIQGAVARVGNELSFATHRFFKTNGFVLARTPIITTADCEGAGEQFSVTTLDLTKALPQTSEGKTDFSKDFFGAPATLTVSGQLNGEMYACGLSDIYTFGPTFRAENSNTPRHLAEFWMIEPEMAWADLDRNMTVAQNYLKYVTRSALVNCAEDIEFFDKTVENGLIARLTQIVEKPFERMTYTRAVEILQSSGKEFQNPVSWGGDLNSEHERYLTEEVVKGPLILTDYPKELKSFYMRDNPDGKTVAAMDVLLPKIGEVIGGSVREERLEILEGKMRKLNMKMENYQPYLDLRRYGTIPHAGFGLGFERLIRNTTGIENIRDVIPFPRYPGHAYF